MMVMMMIAVNISCALCGACCAGVSSAQQLREAGGIIVPIFKER